MNVTLFNQRGKIGFGCIIRDQNDVMVVAQNDILNGSMVPIIAEAICYKEALN